MSLYGRFSDDWIWGLKYRPKNIDEIILPKSLKTQVKKFIKERKIPNCLFTGSPGRGKTALAIVLAEELDSEYLYINGSEQTGIDVLRNNIRQFVTTTNWENRNKLVIIDEADRSSASLQDGLKSAIEEFSKGCSFIFISNHKNKIIPPLQSRLQLFDFNFTKKEEEVIKKEFFLAVISILEKEEVKYDKKVVANIIQRIFPDLRKCLNELQKFAQQELLVDQDLIKNLQVDESEFYKLLVERKLSDVRNFVSTVSDAQTFYSKLYDSCFRYIDPKDLPEFILLLGKYTYELNFVSDERINLMAFSTEVIANCNLRADNELI
jgi:replication factor C small subunit